MVRKHISVTLPKTRVCFAQLYPFESPKNIHIFAAVDPIHFH